ncbi:MAG: FUSC family protein [Rikenellaceae bacterium]|nr:FUSC family protein [Rikenellaceae bacterium]
MTTQNTFSRVIHRIDLLSALLKAVAILLAYVFGDWFADLFSQGSGAIWLGVMLACTSAVIVIDTEGVRSSIKMGWLRLLGTFMGAVLAYVYLLLFEFNIGGMALAVVILSLICMAFGIPDGGKIATITLIIVLVVSKIEPNISPLLNGALRFGESAVGTLIGIGVSWVAEKLKKST